MTWENSLGQMASGSGGGNTSGAKGSRRGASSTRPSPPLNSERPGQSPGGGGDEVEVVEGEEEDEKEGAAAQVWRMVTKAKTSMAALPNTARIENLTWRLFSMQLKKRRTDAEAAENAAAYSALERENEAAVMREAAKEELEGGDELGGMKEKEVEEDKEEDVDREGRGRRGRTSASPSSESPEGFGLEQ